MLDGFRKSLQPQNNRMMMDGDIHANEEANCKRSPYHKIYF